MSFKVGDIVVHRDDELVQDTVCEVLELVYTCRAVGAGCNRLPGKYLRLANTKERAAFAAAQKQKVDKQIAELMAYRKQLEDGIED